MTCARRILVGLIGMLLTGCVSNGLAALDDGPPSVARAQLPELSTPQPRPLDPPGSSGKPNLALPSPPPTQSKLLPAPSPLLPAQAPLDIQQANALLDGSKICVRVRAWVNGRPIFEDELLHSVGPALVEVDGMREPQRSEKIAELFDKVLDHIIDQEVMYQDAVKKLDKHNPKALIKLRDAVDQEYEKRIKKLRDNGMTEDKIKLFGHIAHRIMERDMISMQYAQSIISGSISARVTLEAIEDYYKQHPTEFTVKDRVEWQDVFIAVGPKHPTLADARRFAEQLVSRCQSPDDFAKIQAYDDGDSKLRGGTGFGQRQGEIQPAALEPYLFALKEGQIGPVIEISTGVHVFRVLKREYAGVRPMDDQVQKTIRRQLEGKLIEREYRQLARKMRSRAVVQVVRDLP